MAHRTVDVGRRALGQEVLAWRQDWGDLSIHGNTNLATPHIDSLARDGVRFDRFYVCPLCAPTRCV